MKISMNALYVFTCWEAVVSHRSVSAQDTCSNEDFDGGSFVSETLDLDGYGSPIECPVGSAASQYCNKFQNCGSGGCQPWESSLNKYCEDSPNQRIGCSGSPGQFVGEESDWKGTSSQSGFSAWNFCAADQAISSVCRAWVTSSGDNTNPCEVTPDGKKHATAIRCRSLGQRYVMLPEFHWVCDRAGECPKGYVPVGMCGTGNLQGNCRYNGCSGQTYAYMGLKCQRVAYLKSMDWKLADAQTQKIFIVRDENPVSVSSLKLNFMLETRFSASASASAAYQAQFGVSAEAEGKILAEFGLPSVLGAIFSGPEGEASAEAFAEFSLETVASSAASFQAAAEAMYTATAEGEVTAYIANPFDVWRENFVRLVNYKVTRTIDAIGTVVCCSCASGETDVIISFETEQTGSLALYIKKYPGLRLESISAKQFVLLYLNGDITGYSQGRVLLEQTSGFIASIFNFLLSPLFAILRLFGVL